MVDEIIVGFEDAIREPIVAHERQTFSTELTSGHFEGAIEVFLKSSIAPSVGAQLPAERLLGDGDPKFLENPLRQIDQPPAHHAMDRSDRAIVDHAGDGLALGVMSSDGWPGDLPSSSPSRPRALNRNTQSRMI